MSDFHISKLGFLRFIHRYTGSSEHSRIIMNVIWPRLLTPTQLSQIIKTQKNPKKALQIFNEAKSKYPNYNHNGPVYAAMINILGNSGQISDMKQVIEQMKSDSCECKDSVFSSAIKTYARFGLLDDAVSLFKDIPKFNCVNYTDSFNTLLLVMVNESRLETAHSLFIENCRGWEVVHRTRSMNLLIEALCRNKKSDLALQIFLEMNYQCCYPDRETYRILMRGLCNDGRLHEATHLLYSMFWRISQKGSGEDIVVYRTLLDALCDDGKVEEAIEILDKVLRKGLKAPSRYRQQIDLNRCDHGADLQAAKVLINEALVKCGIPSYSSYNSMAVDLYSEGKICDANKVLDEMREGGFRPGVLIYEAKIEALCREGKVNAALEVLDKEIVDGNCVPSIKLYNIVMKGLCDQNKSDVAVAYLGKISRQIGCVPNDETYRILVNGLCSESRFVEASGVMEKMLIKSYWPSVESFTMVIKGLCSVRRPYDAIMWLEEMISQGKYPDCSVWHCLVACVCSDGDFTDVTFQILTRLRKTVGQST